MAHQHVGNREVEHRVAEEFQAFVVLIGPFGGAGMGHC